MKLLNTLIFFLTMILLLLSCEKDSVIDDKKNPEAPPVEKNKTNEWIEKTLRKHYLYYKDMPATTDQSSKAEDLFYSLLSPKDGKTYEGDHYYYSRIEEYTPTKADNKISTYGFEFATLEGNGFYFVMILYVLPNSPAEEAGLQRGEWIVGVDGKDSNIKDLNVLRSGAATKLSIAHYDAQKKTFVLDKEVDISAARLVEDTPFLCDTTIHKDGHTIGYMVYNHFTVGLDETDMTDTTYDTQMIEIMKKFQSQEVTDFVLDLRYNGGGNLLSAQKMTTMLAPKSALNQTFCILEENDLQKDRRSSYALESKLVSETNLNLSRLYVLVSAASASASELVVNALIPYFGRENIILIGAQTEGKNVGSITYGIDQDYGYLLYPITFHIYNKDHKADYAEGFIPDVKCNELSTEVKFYPFGDEREIMLNEAISRITGQHILESKAAMHKTDASEQKIRYTPKKRGLIKY